MEKYIILFLFIIFTNLFGSVDEYISGIQSYLETGEYQKANVEFEQAIKDFDANAALYFMGGEVAVKLDRLDDANKYFIKAIELDNKNEEYRSTQQWLEELKNSMTSARQTFDGGRIDDAIIEFEKLTETFPQHAIGYYNLGRVYKVNKEYDSAVLNYKKAGELNPFEEKYSLAIIAIAQEMAKEGDTEYRRQEFDSAIENYKKAIQYSSAYTTAYFKLARTYFKMNDYENTRIILEENLAVDPNQEQSEKMLGDIYRSIGNPDNAIEHYNKAISINGNYYKAYYSLGAALLSEGQNEEARDALNTAILLEPTYAKAYGALGTVEQELGDIDSAIENYIHATEIDPNAYKIHYRLASAFNLIQQGEDAKVSARQCLNIKRNYAPAYFELGIAEKALGNKVAAADAFEKAKKDKNWRKSAQFELDMLSKGLAHSYGATADYAKTRLESSFGREIGIENSSIFLEQKEIKGQTKDFENNVVEQPIDVFSNNNIKMNISDYVGIMDITPSLIDNEITLAAYNLLSVELVNMACFTLIERGDIEKILIEQKLQNSECTDSRCAVEIGQLLNAKYIIIPAMSKIGKTFSFTAKLVNVETGIIVKAASYSNRTKEIDLYIEKCTKHIANELCG